MFLPAYTPALPAPVSQGRADNSLVPGPPRGDYEYQVDCGADTWRTITGEQSSTGYWLCNLAHCVILSFITIVKLSGAVTTAADSSYSRIE